MRTRKPLYLALALALTCGSAGAASVSTSTAPSSTEAQRTEMNTRVQLAQAIAQKVQSDAVQTGANEKWRLNLLTELYSTASSDLKGILEKSNTLKDAMTQTRLLRTQAKPAAGAKALATPSDLVFTPLTPCRFADTRVDVVDGPVNTGIPRDYDLVFTGSQYGGDAGCKAPATTTFGLAINATIVAPVATATPAGFLSFRHPQNLGIETSFINWPTGGTPGLANAGVISTGTTIAGNQGFEAISGGLSPVAVDLVVDFFGYFSAAPAGPLALDCIAVEGSVTTISPNQPGDAVASCPVSVDPATQYSAVSVNCTGYAGPAYGVLTGTVVDNYPDLPGAPGSAFYGGICSYQNNNATALPTSASVQCCRVPGN